MTVTETPVFLEPFLANPFLDMAAAVLDGAEGQRIENENRLRQMTRRAEDKDGEDRGFGMMPVSIAEMVHGEAGCKKKECRKEEGKGAPGSPLSPAHQFEVLVKVIEDELREAASVPRRPRCPADWEPDVWNLGVIMISFKKTEDSAVSNLQRLMKEHPLWGVLGPLRGAGEKQCARMLAAIGDPFIRPQITRKGKDGEPDAVESSRPRSFDELKSYCGYGVRDFMGDDGVMAGVAPMRQRGVAMNWTPDGRQRTFLVAEKIVMQLRKPCVKDEDLGYAIHPEGCECTDLRLLYDRTRKAMTGKVHVSECTRCAPTGQKAPVGSSLSKAHLDLRAKRRVAQALLRLVYRESRRLHVERALAAGEDVSAYLPPRQDPGIAA